MRIAPLLLALCICAAVFVACNEADSQPPRPEEIAPDQASTGAIQVVERDYGFELSSLRASAGRIDFVLCNMGTDHHEFVIVPVDGGRYGMPAGEIESFEPGQQRAIRVTLAPGSYVLVCLIATLRSDVPVSHLSLGMITPFEVTDG